MRAQNQQRGLSRIQGQPRKTRTSGQSRSKVKQEPYGYDTNTILGNKELDAKLKESLVDLLTGYLSVNVSGYWKAGSGHVFYTLYVTTRCRDTEAESSSGDEGQIAGDSAKEKKDEKAGVKPKTKLPPQNCVKMFSVEKRYTDFKMLHRALSSVCKNAGCELPPPLPESDIFSWVREAENSVIEKRVKMFQDFLDFCVELGVLGLPPHILQDGVTLRLDSSHSSNSPPQNSPSMASNGTVDIDSARVSMAPNDGDDDIDASFRNNAAASVMSASRNNRDFASASMSNLSIKDVKQASPWKRPFRSSVTRDDDVDIANSLNPAYSRNFIASMASIECIARFLSNHSLKGVPGYEHVRSPEDTSESNRTFQAAMRKSATYSSADEVLRPRSQSQSPETPEKPFLSPESPVFGENGRSHTAATEATISTLQSTEEEFFLTKQRAEEGSPNWKKQFAAGEANEDLYYYVLNALKSRHMYVLEVTKG